jgi:medium-chain acyl-[acyl-carrier-protein] hydrolase
MTLASRPAKTPKNPWFLCFRPASRARLRLVCFPHAGGTAAAYRSFPSALPAGIEVLGLQLPGRGSRFKEPLAVRLGPLLDVLAGEAEKLAADAPLAFFGHSMGALIAFELARHLRRRGAPLPLSLLVAGYRAPGLPEESAPLHPLSEAAFLREVQRYGGLPQSVLEQPELLEMVVPILRADFELIETWNVAPEAPLAVPITAFGGQSDASASEADMRAWSAHTERPFALHMLPGDHFFVQSAEPALLDLVRGALAEALPAAST